MRGELQVRRGVVVSGGSFSQSACGKNERRSALEHSDPTSIEPRAPSTAAMLLFTHLRRHRPLLCRQLARDSNCSPQHASLRRGKKTWASGQRPSPDAETLSKNQAAEWETKARDIRSGAQQSMLTVLEERGFVKDVAG